MPRAMAMATVRDEREAAMNSTLPPLLLRPRVFAAVLMVFGISLAAAVALGRWHAPLFAWLAQAPLALGWQAWRTRDATWAASARAWPPLLALWALALVAMGALLAWPLQALDGDASLGAVLVAGVAVAAVLLAAWRAWPLWPALQQPGSTLAQAWRALPNTEWGVWRGLWQAVLVFALLAPALALWPAWPMSTGMRLGLALLLAVWAWLAHGLLLRIAVPEARASLPLHDDIAAPSGRTEAAPADASAEDLDRALYQAARNGRVEQALALLEAGADAHAPAPAGERDRRGLAMLAAVLPDLRLLRALIREGVEVNANEGGSSVLLAATRDSWHGRPEAVMTLLANGADARVRDADGNTPLHHAARSTDPGVAALLRDAGAALDAANAEGTTPLGVACAVGNWRLARFLLECGARVEPADAQPCLLAAAATDDDDAAGVQLLLKHKARVDARNAAGESALHLAAAAGHVEIVEALLTAHADAMARDHAGRSALHAAAAHARSEVIERLLALRPQARALLTVTDAAGHDPLMLACAAPAASPALVARLCDLGADPGACAGDGRRAVDIAAEAGRWALVRELDSDYPLPAAVVATAAGEGDAEARPPRLLLHEALAHGRLDGAEALWALLPQAERDGLLADADLLADARVLAWLLAAGADPERHHDGDTALGRLLARGPVMQASLRVLLAHPAAAGGRGLLARWLAACHAAGDSSAAAQRIALELLARGADPFSADPRAAAGDPPLALAVRLGWLPVLEALLACGAWTEQRDSHGMTALHLLAALGRAPLLAPLLKRGASPLARAADGQTALGIALASGRRDLADWLDWRGWVLPARALTDADLPAAAIVGDADAVRRLLDLGLPVDATDAQHCTALLRAAGGGHRALVDMLLARGADTARAARTGATPLSAAVSMRQPDIADALVRAGAPLEQALPGGVTVLMLAAALGQPDMAARLLALGAEVDARDDQQLTALHCAALYGFGARDRSRLLALLDTLLLAGADADASADGGLTPLLLLLGARAEPGAATDEDALLGGLERLLDEEVSLAVRDARGFGPLHLAALHGHLHLLRLLLRAGAEPAARDAINRTPREIALMRGFVDLAAELDPEPNPAAPSLARFLREPPR